MSSLTFTLAAELKYSIVIFKFFPEQSKIYLILVFLQEKKIDI